MDAATIACEVDMSAEWQAILDRAHAIHVDARLAGTSVWFRGHASSDWPLVSSVHRSVLELIESSGRAISDGERRTLLCDELKSLYHMFKNDSWSLLQPHERGEWSLVFHMQHHGIPTRLLDWTESFACALFFAQEGRSRDQDAAIFALRPATLNSLTVGVSDQIALDEEMAPTARELLNRWHPKFADQSVELPSIAVTPILASRRMVAQRAAFTLCGDSFASLETLYPDAFTKIILPATMYDEAECLLELVGAGPFGYFPDFDGLRRKYRERQRWYTNEYRKSRRP